MMNTFAPTTLGSPGRGTPVLPFSGAEIAAILRDADAIGTVLVANVVTTTTLAPTGGHVFVNTGTASQSIKLPKESALAKSSIYFFINKSSSTMSIRSSGNTILAIGAAGNVNPTFVIAILVDPTKSDATAWATVYIATGYALGKSLTVSKTITLNALSDGLTYTLPGSTNCAIAATDIDSVFSVDQTFQAKLIMQNSVIRKKVFAVGALPGAGSVQGDCAMVNDANAPVFGNVPVAGGLSVVPVYYDGTNWRVG